MPWGPVAISLRLIGLPTILSEIVLVVIFGVPIILRICAYVISDSETFSEFFNVVAEYDAKPAVLIVMVIKAKNNPQNIGFFENNI